MEETTPIIKTITDDGWVIFEQNEKIHVCHFCVPKDKYAKKKSLMFGPTVGWKEDKPKCQICEEPVPPQVQLMKTLINSNL